MRRGKQRKPMKQHVTRRGRMVGSYVPFPVVDAIHKWIEQEPERDISTFIRQAAREKLNRDGIAFDERATIEEVA